ncbi:Tc toxin subunit A-related protein [Roseitranquillus sediminis]|uniref:Tc toxin subunit A-related protein n=1 Tax=Roseitranquillus sediminis TaxID=2809051 RepID=UPI001D0C4CD5|nr:hypothetical protein [Roseitranquillus sediminis]MBM9593826.1 hypothetical protein [Roseitranquillus sediminis]
MEPAYFLENRYSFVIDFQLFPERKTYEVETAETAFERNVQAQLAAANRLLMARKYSAALARYRHVRGIVAVALRPSLSIVNAELIDWTATRMAASADSIVAKSAAMLEARKPARSALPDSVTGSAVELSRGLDKTFDSFEVVGVADDQAKVGRLIDEATIRFDGGKFREAAQAFEQAAALSGDPGTRAALRHDVALAQEKAGDRDDAIRTLERTLADDDPDVRSEIRAATMATLAGTLVRRGDDERARRVAADLRGLQSAENLHPVIRPNPPEAEPADLSPVLSPAARANIRGATLRRTDLAARPVTPVARGGEAVLGGRLADTPVLRREPPAREPASRDAAAAEDLAVIAAEPARLLSSEAFISRRSDRTLAVLASDHELQRVALDRNASTNLSAFFEKIRTTRDIAVLTGYVANPATTIAYLTHVSLWVIPMAMGDCLAALGDYEAAEAEYLGTLDYKYLNEVVEVVNVWIRLAELYNDWGDRLYRHARNEIEEFGPAREMYSRVLRLDLTVDGGSPLYAAPRFVAMRQRAERTITRRFVSNEPDDDNPRIAMALMHARMQLFKIDAGLNYLGISVATPPFSFEYLQNVARYFAQHAAQVEQMYIQFQSGGELEELREDQMAQQVELTQASVELERRGLDEAQAGLEVARANRNAARVQRQNAQQANNDFQNVRWELLELSQAEAWASAAAVDEDDEIKQTWNGHYYSSKKKRRSVVLKELAYRRGKISNELESNRLQREIASAQAYEQVAEAQIDQAEARIDVARQRIEMAKLQKQHAQENLDFLKGREFTSAMWYNLAREAGRLTSRYLDMAIEGAVMMEVAYRAETGRDLRKIKFEYGKTHLNGLLGSDALLADIDYFTLDHIRTRSKKAPMKHSVSLADSYPMAFERLLATGSTYFETTLEQFDRLYPGFYLQKVKQVELVVIGLNGTEGLHGTLRNIGVSQFRQKSGEVEMQVYPADVMPLSEYDVRRDAIVFQLDPNELRLFENNGVATMWRLDLPRNTNTFDLRNILDVHLVVSYDGFHDPGLETMIRDALPTSGSASRGISLRLYAPDELYFLRSQGTARLALTPGLFPANQVDQTLTGYTLKASGAGVAGLRVRVAYEALGAEHTFVLDADGTADGAAFLDPVGRPLFDTMTFTVESDAPDFDLAGLTDLALFVEYDFDYRG